MKTNFKWILNLIVLISVFISFTGCGPVTPAPVPTNTPETLSIKPVQVTGPQIARQSPLPEERLSLSPAIELTFDRDMNRAKTESAWKFFDADGNPIEGQISWKDNRTFQFKPSVQLNADASYSGVLSTSATAQDNSTLAQEVHIQYRTVDALEVGQTFPANDAIQVPTDSTITVIFNKPVVPVSIKEEQASLPQPITISPALDGQGEWINSSVYVFQPAKRLNGGTSYKVSVEAGLIDTTGSKLDQSYSWKFSTESPQIVHYALKDGEANPTRLIPNVLLDQAFVFNFNQPMDPASVTQAFSIRNRETQQMTPVRFKWDEDFTALTVQPTQRFAIASFYDVVVAKTARGANGGALDQETTIKFSTVPLPSILSTEPRNNSRQNGFSPWFTINFASPMRFATIKDKIQISPKPKNKIEMYYYEYGNQLTIYGLEPSTDYVVRIAPGASDIYGNTIKSEYSFSFQTARIDPSAYMYLPGTPLIYRPNGPQSIFFRYTNVNSAEISVYQLSFEEFSTMMSGAVKGSNSAPEYSNPKHNQPVFTWKLDSPAPENESKRVKIDFAKNGKRLAPGYYLLGLNAKPVEYHTKFLQAALFIVATDNITFKTTDSEALAWLVDINSGKPTANVPVDIYDQNFVKLGSLTTDKDGLAYLGGIKTPTYVRAENSQHIAFASNNWGAGVSAGDFGPWSQYYGPTTGPFAYLYTDRPLYRPGQEVYFKGIVRQDDDLHYTLPSQKQVYVKIENEGEKVYEDKLDISDTGTFNGVFKLGDDAKVGSYDLYLGYENNDKFFASISFRVAEYHKPEFQVNVAPDKANVLKGESVTFKLDANYYSGGNVVNGEAKWFVEAAPYSFTPTSDYSSFSFNDYDWNYYESNVSQPFGGVLAEGTATTDANGHAEITQTANLGKDNLSRQLTLYANVTDVAGSLVSGSASVVVHQSAAYAGIRPLQYVGREGEEQTFEVAALDWDSKPLAGHAVSVDFIKQEWFSVQKQNKDGRLEWVTSVKETPIKREQNVVVDENGLAQVKFIPPVGGIYKALVTIHDDHGNTHKASTQLWVSGDEYIPWQQTNDRKFDLVADKSIYTPGDTAKILIAQPFEGEVYALITYERGHIYSHKVMLLKDNSTVYDLPVTKDMAPGVYVSVVVIRPSQGDKPADFKMGITQIKVDTSQQTLTVNVSADKKVVGPGDQVTYTVTTKDAKKNPVQAEVSLALVDKSVLALSGPNSGPIVDSFYPQRALSVQTALGLVLSAEDFNANYESDDTGRGGGSGGGGKGSGDLGVIDVRQNFKDTAYYKAVIATDKNGTAQVTVTMPDNLTTWRMDARAVTEDSRVGQGTSELVTTKAIFIQLQTPRFFVVSDSAQIGAAIHNNTDKDMMITASLDAQGVKLKSDAKQVVKVNAKQQAYVTWDVDVDPTATRVDFTASAEGNGFKDSTRPTLGTLEGNGIPVYAYHTTETVGTAGILQDAGSMTESIAMPQSLDYYDAQLKVQLSPSLAASMKDGLTYLKDYPYLCMEQTISRFLPNVISSRALQLAGQTNPLQADLDREVSNAMQRIYNNQLSDGGWAWWGAPNSDPLTSAYVVLGLVEAKKSGYEVSPAALARGIEYLQNHLPTLDDNAGMSAFNQQAFIVYVLARAESSNSNGANFLFTHKASIGIYGKALLAHAMYLSDPNDKRIQDLLADIVGSASVSAAGAHWEEKEIDYWNWNTDVRTTAIVLNMLTDVDPKNPLSANTVRWLMAHRNGTHWSSTQETAWVLMSLTNWLSVSHEFETNYPYAVGMNNDLIKEGNANTNNLTDPINVTKAITEEMNYLVVTRGSGDGNLYYSAYLDLALPVNDVKSLDQGISITRQYYSFNDLKKPITEIQRGELVQARITVVVPSSVHYVVIDDPLPAGFEAVDSSLLTSAEVPTKYTLQDYDRYGWGWWYFPYKGIYDEKVVLSTDYLPAGTYIFTYIARASTAGTFNVMPVTAQEFYFPDVGGRGAGSVFVVKP